MTTTSSRVPEALDWLTANLPDICGVPVVEGPPTNKTQREHVELLGGSMEQDYRTMGLKPGGPTKEETATIDLAFVSMLPGKTNADARRRVFELHDLVDARLRSNPMRTLTLGGLVCWVLFAPVEWAYMVGDNARGCVLHSSLEVHEKTL